MIALILRAVVSVAVIFVAAVALGYLAGVLSMGDDDSPWGWR